MSIQGIPGSPQSLVSQILFSPRKHDNNPYAQETEAEMLSQQQFCTQAPATITRSWFVRPSPPELPTKQNSNIIDGRPQALEESHNDVQPSLSAKNSPLKPRTLEIPQVTMPAVNSALSSQHPTTLSTTNISRALLQQDDNDKSSPVEMAELCANIPSPARPLRSSLHKLTREPSVHAGPTSLGAPLPSSSKVNKRLQHLRQFARGDGYLPRRRSKIPKEQAKLLEEGLRSGASWQPPLVGEPQIPGQAPRMLMEKYSKYADERAENPNSQSLEPAQADDESSSEDEEEIEWSQSQPTQQRRQQRPTSVKSSDASSESSEGSPDISPSPTSPQRRLPALPPNSPPVASQLRKQVFDSLAQDVLSSQSGGSIQDISTNDIQTVEAAEPRSHSSGVQETLPMSASKTPLTLKPSHKHESYTTASVNAKKIQVERTPFPAKESNLHEQIIADTDEPMPTHVPGTYLTSTTDAVAAARDRDQEKPSRLTSVFGLTPTVLSSNGSEVVRNQSRTQTTSTQQQNRASRSLGQTDPQFTPNLLDTADRNQAQLGHQNSNKTVDIRDTEIPPLACRAEQAKEINRPGSAESLGGQRDCGHNSVQSTYTKAAAPGAAGRKRPVSEGVDGPSKRQRRNPGTATTDDLDFLAIIQDTRCYRREQLQPMRKPEARTPHTASPSVGDVDKNDNLVKTPLQPTKTNRSQMSRSASRHSSTPITRQSTYGEDWNGKSRAGAGIPVMQNPQRDTTGSDENLFTRYRSAYPDYGGDMDEFRDSYCFIQGVLNSEPNTIHPSLLDDAIYHHLHSYQPYRNQAGTAAMGFVRFFHECVQDPTHHKRIVKTTALTQFPRRDSSRKSTMTPSLVHKEQRSSDARSAAHSAAFTSVQPTPSTRDPLSELQKDFLERTASAVEPKPALSQESLELIQQWRENAAPRDSPELGEPHVDRSRPTPLREQSVSISKPPAPSPRVEQQQQSRPTRSTSRAPIHVATPRSQNRATTSASSMAKPQRPAVQPGRHPTKTGTTIASSAKTRVHKRRSVLGIGTNTAFKAFEERFSKLASEKKTVDKSSTGMPIDIFSWRK